MMLDPIALAYEAEEASAFERAVLDGLQRAVGFDAAFFAAVGEAPSAVGMDVDTLSRALAAGTYDEELLPLKRAAGKARGVVVDTRVLGEREARRRAYHRELAAPIGGRHGLVAFLALRGRPLGAFVLGRTGSCFTDAEIETVADLLPSISIARVSYRAPWHGTPLPRAPAAMTRALARLRNAHDPTRVDTPGGSLFVRDRGGYREMVHERGGRELVWTRSDVREPRRSGWFYVDLFHLAAARARARSRALFIGCGGALSVRQFAEVYPGIVLDVVDVSEAAIQLARDWFALGAIPHVSVHIAEGSEFMANAPASSWDVIVVDAYGAGLARPFLSREFFRQARRTLRRGGQIAFNVIGTLAGQGDVQAVERCARAELSDVRLVPVLDPGERYDATAVRNVVVIGGTE